jgi:hypothetical protein
VASYAGFVMVRKDALVPQPASAARQGADPAAVFVMLAVVRLFTQHQLAGRCQHEPILRFSGIARTVRALVHLTLSLSCRRSAGRPPLSRISSTRLLVTRSSRTLRGPNRAHASRAIQGAVLA